jgi:threonine dehydrogenase-like Zn-dependent dehydrogenase
MRGLIFDGDRPILRDDLPMPTPRPGDALVRVIRAGICKTDLEILRGYMGFTGVMGHEFVGVVEQGPTDWNAKRVVGEINFACGRCEFCRTGLGNHCPHRSVMGIQNQDGCFAEYLAIPVRNLHEVPAEISDDQAVFVEPLAAACRIPAQLDLPADGDRALVLGDGRLGLLCAMVLREHLQDALLVGRHPDKLRHAASRGIATALETEVRLDKTWPIVVDATGSPAGLTAAMQAIRPCGTIVLKSTVAAETGMNFAPIVIDEVRVLGSRCGPFEDALRLLHAGRMDPTDLITARYPLDQGVEALETAGRSDQCKVVLDVQ